MSTDAQSYTVLWDAERCNWLAKSGEIGKPIEVIFGGVHQSVPSLTRFKVKPGDDVYPVRVHQRVLYVIARLRVSDIVPLEEYFRTYLKLPKKLLKMDLWDLEEKLWKDMPELGHRLPYGCIVEAAIGQGTPMTLHCAVPPGLLESIRYRSQRGERPIKHVEGGQLQHAISMHGGVYRLSPDSARDFENLVVSGTYTA